MCLGVTFLFCDPIETRPPPKLSSSDNKLMHTLNVDKQSAVTV